MRRMLNMLLIIILTPALTYAALVVLIYFSQERLVYFPVVGMPAETPADHGMPYEQVWLEAADGVRLHAWYVPARGDSARGTALFFHGNGGNMTQTLWDVEGLHRQGFHVLTLDYRGYGMSGGSPHEAGIYLDAAAAWRYLTEDRQVPPESILLSGHSLGGGVAAWLAHEHPPGALALHSTFTRMTDIGKEAYPFLPVRLLSRNRYPTIDRLPAIDVPVLITHGSDDETIPVEHGQRLYAAANDPSAFVALPGGHGVDFTDALEHDPATVQAFLAQAFPLHEAE